VSKAEYQCECCGEVFLSGKKFGRHLCRVCAEIRRYLRRIAGKERLTVGQVLTRAGKLLMDDAQVEFPPTDKEGCE